LTREEPKPGLLLVAMRVAGLRRQVRQEVVLVLHEHGARLAHAVNGDLKVEVGVEGTAYQAVQLGVVELVPPGGFGFLCHELRRLRVDQRRPARSAPVIVRPTAQADKTSAASTPIRPARQLCLGP